MNIRRLGIPVLALALVGCAANQNPHDPFEHYNRAMFTVNDKADQYVLKPVATAYHATLPSFVQTGVGNFFGNLADIWTGTNNVLQGKVHNGLSDFTRFGINSTVGIGGLFDVGTAVGLPKHNKDFGLTLGWWGVSPGPYLVLPLLGPSTLRDSLALPLDYAGDPWSYKYPVRQRNEGTILRIIDRRASALNASKLVEDAALDRYEFVRDGYLQRRQSQVLDGDEQQSKPGDAVKPAAPIGSGASDEPAVEPVDKAVKPDVDTQAPQTKVPEKPEGGSAASAGK
jgi:phospholipid-binding lipoprotein MlaA